MLEFLVMVNNMVKQTGECIIGIRLLQGIREASMNQLAKKALISRVLRFKRYPGTDIVRDKGWQVYSGDAWWSFTNGFVKVLVDFEDEMLKYWIDCYVSDECFAATVIKHTPEYLSNWSNFYTREIDWVRGFPYTWGNESCDYDMLMNSTAIFARKFDPNKMEIVNKLYDELIARKNHEEGE